MDQNVLRKPLGLIQVLLVMHNGENCVWMLKMLLEEEGLLDL